MFHLFARLVSVPAGSAVRTRSSILMLLGLIVFHIKLFMLVYINQINAVHVFKFNKRASSIWFGLRYQATERKFAYVPNNKCNFAHLPPSRLRSSSPI